MARRRRRNHARVVEDVEARAARLGITPERVLREYARIAFSNIRQVVDWDDEKGIKVKPSTGLDPEVVAAIAEIVASASSQKIYRVKLHDKKPVLDSIARYLGMLPPLKDMADDEVDPPNDTKDPREFILHELDRAEAEDAAGANPQSEG
jgi:phage terminase small subunit